MMGLTAGIVGDGATDKRTVNAAIDALRNGKTAVLKIYADEYIQQYASDDDYKFWMSEKRKALASEPAA